MRHLHYLKIKNFKGFGEEQRIDLEHPSVLIGPNNSGKTSVIQALALWSQAVRAWFDARKQSKAKKRTGIPLNRLDIVAIPVLKTRFFWHGAQARAGNTNIQLVITVGVAGKEGKVRELGMRFRNEGDEIVYCNPEGDAANDLSFIGEVAKLNVALLYSMSGLDIEEPILQAGRIDVLLGQGRTAEVLRNLCMTVYDSSKDDWLRIVLLMERLFKVKLQTPEQTTRGGIALFYKQDGVREDLDLSSAGRGLLQMLLVFAYLYSHKNGVLLIDEPDAHLEILRQKQVYVLLRDIASANNSQIVIVTHSEVILNEALENNLTLLLEGKSDNLARKQDIRNSLRNFGAEHYVKARESGHVLYVEGSTDVDMLRALAGLVKHPVAEILDAHHINSYYVRNSHSSQDSSAELERVEGGFGMSPREHFNSLRGLLPNLKALAILDNDGRNTCDQDDGNLKIRYWKRYEIENYFITPDVLKKYVLTLYPEEDLFLNKETTDRTLASAVLKHVFDGKTDEYETWANSPSAARQLLWEAQTKDKKLSLLAEIFFQELAGAMGTFPLLRKGEFHRLVTHACLSKSADEELRDKLDLLNKLLRNK